MTKPKIITNDDLINALPKERQDKINAAVEKTVAKWDGVRANSGRKRVTGQVLDFTKRLTEKKEYHILVRINAQPLRNIVIMENLRPHSIQE